MVHIRDSGLEAHRMSTQAAVKPGQLWKCDFYDVFVMTVAGKGFGWWCYELGSTRMNVKLYVTIGKYCSWHLVCDA